VEAVIHRSRDTQAHKKAAPPFLRRRAAQQLVQCIGHAFGLEQLRTLDDANQRGHCAKNCAASTAIESSEVWRIADSDLFDDTFHARCACGSRRAVPARKETNPEHSSRHGVTALLIGAVVG
jgi:hypothetical protein